MAFKMKGFPMIQGTSPTKHIRSEEKRPGHNKKYHTTDPSNAAHDGTDGTSNYWSDGSKEEEIAAAESTQSADVSTPDVDETTEAPKKKRNLIQRLGDELRKGHKTRKKTDADYKANKKRGESKHQYNVRKRREELQAAKKKEMEKRG
jgi:hypothetical protein